MKQRVVLYAACWAVRFKGKEEGFFLLEGGVSGPGDMRKALYSKMLSFVMLRVL